MFDLVLERRDSERKTNSFIHYIFFLHPLNHCLSCYTYLQPEQSPTLPSPVLTPVTAYSSNSNSFPPPALTPASSTLISMTVPPKSTSKSTQASSSGKRSHSEVEQDVQVLQDKLEDVERRVKRAKVVDLGMAVMGAVTAFIGAGLGVTYWGGQ